jgi:hypothetical protein
MARETDNPKPTYISANGTLQAIMTNLGYLDTVVVGKAGDATALLSLFQDAAGSVPLATIDCSAKGVYNFGTLGVQTPTLYYTLASATPPLLTVVTRKAAL